MIDDNQEVTVDELKKIRELDDFNLTMLISEIHDHGWAKARVTLAMMLDAINANVAAKGRPQWA